MGGVGWTIQEAIYRIVLQASRNSPPFSMCNTYIPGFTYHGMLWLQFQCTPHCIMIILPLALSIVRVHLSVLKHTVMWYHCLEIGCNSTSTESQKGNPLILCNLTTHNIYTVHVYLLLCCPTHVQYYPGHQWRNHSVQIHGSCPRWLMDLTHRQVIVYTTPKHM